MLHRIIRLAKVRFFLKHNEAQKTGFLKIVTLVSNNHKRQKISELRWWECLNYGLKFTALNKILVSMFISFWFCDVNSARQILRPENE